MSRLKQIRLGDHAKLISGYAFKSEHFSHEGIPVVKIANVTNGAVVFHSDNTDYLPVEMANSVHNKFRIVRGDILISLTGSHMTQPNSVVGRVAPYKASYHSLLNQRAGKVVISDTLMLQQTYLYYLLATDAARQEIALLAHGAANQANVSPKDIEKIKFNILPIEDQLKIAAILSAYDDQIENNQRRIVLLEKLAEELYREWFVRLRFPGHEKVKMVKGVPEGWEVKQLGSFALEIKKGVRKKDMADDLKYVGLEHIPRKSINLIDCSTASSIESNKLLFQERDILFGKIRPYLHKVSIAHFAGACSSDTIVIRPMSKVYEGYLLFTVFSDTFVELANVASKGTKMPRADWGFLKKLTLSVPSQTLLEAFQENFNTFYQQMITLIELNKLLVKSRDMLLPRLISGKLSVENLDIQYPPSMLEPGHA